ncbi:MAG: ribosome hibernation-promoting factor, HPF/YfiA family [Sarcina sp.]
MKIKIHVRNITLTDALKDTVEKKILKLEKYFDDNVEAKVTLKVEKLRQIVEVIIPFNGIYLRGEESTENMYKSLDLVEEKLEGQIRKHKTKLKRSEYDSLKFSQIDKEIAMDEYEEEDEIKIVKTKKFDVKPMLPEEAVLQMELIGHNFFVFRDAETNDISVAYKRKDGQYGLIEAEQ